MKRLLIFLMMISSLLGQHIILAQVNYDPDEEAKQYAARRVYDLNQHISYMADKDNDYVNRDIHREVALTLFINDGEPYELHGIRRDSGAVMQLSSINTRNIRTKSVREYFAHLIAQTTRIRTDITSSEVAEMKISDLKHLYDSLYECTVQYVQTYVAHGDRYHRVYYPGDRTTKQIKCYVEKTWDIDSDTGQILYKYLIRLGDTQCVTTEPLTKRNGYYKHSIY